MNRITLLLSLLSVLLSQVLSNELNHELNHELDHDVSSKNLTGSCPGMHVWCPHDQMCCRNDESQYKYMCCPYDHGVCCDHRFNHCCQRGQYCTQWGCSSRDPLLGDSTPENGGWALSEPKLVVPKVEEPKPTSTVVCPDKSSCKETCCEQGKGVYGCCPVPSGVCCKDQAFCCPQGYQCTDSSCIISGGDEVPLINILVNLTPVKKEEEEEREGKEEGLVLEKRIERLEQVTTELAVNSSTRCEDGSRCHGHQTCCPTGSGAYNCCPYRAGVCCSNGKNCCPPGFECQLDSCVVATTSVPLSNSQQRTLDLINNVAENFNLRHVPDDDVTNDVTNDVSNYYDVSNDVEDIPDPDADYPIYCGVGALCTGNKCCQISGTEQYHCCPFEGGVCCGTYCCPQPFMCGNDTDPEGMPCKPRPPKMPVPKPRTAKLLHVLPQDIKCSDDVSTCPDGQTCCAKPDGTFNCAPFPNATCCTDGIHACPEGFICERDTNLCKPVITEPVVEMVDVSPRVEVTGHKKITCDEEMECTDNQTCCLLPDTSFGCCPFPNAICCADRRHCCARGYHCHRADHWKCLPDDITLSTIHAKLDAALTQGAVDTTVLPEGTVDAALVIKPYTALAPAPLITLTHQCNDKYRCSNSMTCCIRPDGSYGCCPYPEAVCCPDKLHCCPGNSSCDMAQQRCINDTVTVPWGSKTPALYTTTTTAAAAPAAAGAAAGAPDQMCGSDYTCPAHTTCCLLSDGGYGCCPYNNAVCCSDGEHCCPEGYTCNVKTGSCHTPQVDEGEDKEDCDVDEDVDEDVDVNEEVSDGNEGMFCKDGKWCKYQCCKTTGGYGCCPLKVPAVCCSDGVHCCPASEGCSSNGACNNATNLLPPSSKVVPEQTMVDIDLPYTVLNTQLVPRLGLVQCNHKYSCPSGTTCCSIEEGEFGCCSYSNATCCEDAIHCCPQGFSCDLVNETCTQGATVQALLPKSPPVTKAEPLDYPDHYTPPVVTEQQICPDNTSSCDTADTCCEVPVGGYGCCPLQNATCCTDSWHCCPPDMYCLGIFGVCYNWDSGNTKVYRDWLTLEEISEEHISSRRNILP